MDKVARLTKQNAEYAPRIITCANIIKNYVGEGNPAVEAAKTTQYAKFKVAINTWTLTLKIMTSNKVVRDLR